MIILQNCTHLLINLSMMMILKHYNVESQLKNMEVQSHCEVEHLGSQITDEELECIIKALKIIKPLGGTVLAQST